MTDTTPTAVWLPFVPRSGCAIAFACSPDVSAGLPVRNLRVRDLGSGTALVEVDASLVADLVARPELLAAVAGFDVVEVDPRGFRSGSMNELLPDPVRYR